MPHIVECIHNMFLVLIVGRGALAHWLMAGHAYETMNLPVFTNHTLYIGCSHAVWGRRLFRWFDKERTLFILSVCVCVCFVGPCPNVGLSLFDSRRAHVRSHIDIMCIICLCVRDVTISRSRCCLYSCWSIVHAQSEAPCQTTIIYIRNSSIDTCGSDAGRWWWWWCWRWTRGWTSSCVLCHTIGQKQSTHFSPKRWKCLYTHLFVVFLRKTQSDIFNLKYLLLTYK